MPIEVPKWPRRSPWMPGAPPFLTNFQQRVYIFTGSDEVSLSWRAFTGLSVETMYVGPQKAAFSMAEGRKKGKRKGLGREAGRSTVDGHESQTGSGSVQLAQFGCHLIFLSTIFSFLSSIVGTTVSMSEDYLLPKMGWQT